MCGNQVFLIFANNSTTKQQKKNPEHPFLGIGKKKTCANFQQKIFNSMVVGTRQSIQFLRQKAWFFENNRALCKFLYVIT